MEKTEPKQESEDINITIKKLIGEKIINRNSETGIFELDCSEAKTHPEFFENLISNPLEILSIINQTLTETFDSSEIKFINFDNNLEISKIRREHINKLFKIKGIIKRITKAIPRTTMIYYECPSCGSVITILQDRRKKNIPHRCSCGRKENFTKTKETIVNIQELNLEEMPEELEGKQPQQLRVYLEGNLTDPTFSGKLQPGKRIEIIGIIKKLPVFMSKHDEDENISDFMFHAINVFNLEEEEDLFISPEDEQKIKEIAKNNPLEILSENLAESIYGYKEIKKAIILQFVKGVPIKKKGGGVTREDIHILLIGDPGVGKSALLKSASYKCPRSKYISGTRSSSVGLTSIVKKDELTGDFCLEAGAFVLANGSVLYLDEIDKMNREYISSLYEPLEIGTVTVNKAGIFACLQSKTSLLGACNPLNGKFDCLKPLTSQLDLPEPLLNRFDLIFAIVDLQNKEQDSKAIQHLFKVYTNEIEEPKVSLSDSLFKKYIIYAKKLKPILKQELLTELENIYYKIRNQTDIAKNKGMPINLRNAEGLLRMAYAHAKLRLSEYVELQDLKVAEEIFMFSLKQLGYDSETGTLDMSRLTMKVPISHRGKLESVLKLLYDLQQQIGQLIPYEEILSASQDLKIEGYELDNILEQLKREGKIFEPRDNYFQLI